VVVDQRTCLPLCPPLIAIFPSRLCCQLAAPSDAFLHTTRVCGPPHHHLWRWVTTVDTAPGGGVMGGGVVRIRTGCLVHRACRSPHARANQGTTPGMPRCGTHGRTGLHAAAGRHHGQDGSSYHSTHPVYASRVLDSCGSFSLLCGYPPLHLLLGASPWGRLLPGPRPRDCKRCATGRGCPRGAPSTHDDARTSCRLGVERSPQAWCRRACLARAVSEAAGTRRSLTTPLLSRVRAGVPCGSGGLVVSGDAS
jgi:hypothetical protein